MAVGSIQPFTPSGVGKGVSIAATTTSSSAALPPTGEDLLLINSGSVIAFVRAGTAATLNDLPLPPNSTTLVSIGPLANSIAAITQSGTTTVNAVRGTGSSR